MFTYFKVITNSYPYVINMAKFGKFGAIHCIFSVLIIVIDMQDFTLINIKLHLRLFWPTYLDVKVWLKL